MMPSKLTVNDLPFLNRTNSNIFINTPANDLTSIINKIMFNNLNMNNCFNQEYRDFIKNDWIKNTINRKVYKFLLLNQASSLAGLHDNNLLAGLPESTSKSRPTYFCKSANLRKLVKSFTRPEFIFKSEDRQSSAHNINRTKSASTKSISNKYCSLELNHYGKKKRINFDLDPLVIDFLMRTIEKLTIGMKKKHKRKSRKHKNKVEEVPKEEEVKGEELKETNDEVKKTTKKEKDKCSQSSNKSDDQLLKDDLKQQLSDKESQTSKKKSKKKRHKSHKHRHKSKEKELEKVVDSKSVFDRLSKTSMKISKKKRHKSHKHRHKSKEKELEKVVYTKSVSDKVSKTSIKRTKKKRHKTHKPSKETKEIELKKSISVFDNQESQTAARPAKMTAERSRKRYQKSKVLTLLKNVSKSGYEKGSYSSEKPVEKKSYSSEKPVEKKRDNKSNKAMKLFQVVSKPRSDFFYEESLSMQSSRKTLKKETYKINSKSNKDKMKRLKKRPKKEMKSDVVTDDTAKYIKKTSKTGYSGGEYINTSVTMVLGSKQKLVKQISEENLSNESSERKLEEDKNEYECSGTSIEVSSLPTDFHSEASKLWADIKEQKSDNKNIAKTVNVSTTTNNIDIITRKLLSDESIIQNIYAERNKHLLNKCADQMTIINKKKEATKLINVTQKDEQKSLTNLNNNSQTVNYKFQTCGKTESFILIECTNKTNKLNKIDKETSMCDCKLKYPEIGSKFHSDDLFDVKTNQSQQDSSAMNIGKFVKEAGNNVEFADLNPYYYNDSSKNDLSNDTQENIISLSSKEENKMYFNENSIQMKNDHLNRLVSSNENNDLSETLIGKFTSTLSHVWESASDKKILTENFKRLTNKKDKLKNFVMSTVDNVSKQLLNHDSTSTFKSFYIENSSRMFDILKPNEAADPSKMEVVFSKERIKKLNKRVTMKTCPFLELRYDLLNEYTEAEMQNFRQQPIHVDSFGYAAEEVIYPRNISLQ